MPILVVTAKIETNIKVDYWLIQSSSTTMSEEAVNKIVELIESGLTEGWFSTKDSTGWWKIKRRTNNE